MSIFNLITLAPSVGYLWTECQGSKPVKWAVDHIPKEYLQKLPEILKQNAPEVLKPFFAPNTKIRDHLKAKEHIMAAIGGSDITNDPVILSTIGGKITSILEEQNRPDSAKVTNFDIAKGLSEKVGTELLRYLSTTITVSTVTSLFFLPDSISSTLAFTTYLVYTGFHWYNSANAPVQERILLSDDSIDAIVQSVIKYKNFDNDTDKSKWENNLRGILEQITTASIEKEVKIGLTKEKRNEQEQLKNELEEKKKEVEKLTSEVQSFKNPNGFDPMNFLSNCPGFERPEDLLKAAQKVTNDTPLGEARFVKIAQLALAFTQEQKYHSDARDHFTQFLEKLKKYYNSASTEIKERFNNYLESIIVEGNRCLKASKEPQQKKEENSLKIFRESVIADQDFLDELEELKFDSERKKKEEVSDDDSEE